MRIQVIKGSKSLAYKKGEIYEVVRIVEGGATYGHASKIVMRARPLSRERALWVRHKNFIHRAEGFNANNGNPLKCVRFVKLA